MKVKQDLQGVCRVHQVYLDIKKYRLIGYDTCFALTTMILKEPLVHVSDEKRDGIASPLKIFSRAHGAHPKLVASIPFHTRKFSNESVCVKYENSLLF